LVTQSLGNLTPEEREAAAKPTAAGDYWREWDAFRAAQRLFADEIDEIDKNSRNKKKTRRIWVNTQSLSRHGLAIFRRVKWRKQRRPLQSGTLRMLWTKKKHKCESHLSFLQEFFD
jgi:hypothetical protein